ncbi:ABC transporter ATP-binding protein [Sinorhizobium medicae]|uniref:ABC transporter ATP-binding protein n=1 Tax=Sinorhizobium medicae TaxID=110321 RepID=UPI000C7AC66D|nr:ABC transporter ATP-binding protein [Sinorhizobium medicae]PLU07851.1 sulfonate ABC transporter ATP-binding protein [Sinorhizobium medicae]
MAEVRSLRRGEVALRDLSKSFRINGRPLSVLRNLNLDIRSGECLAIVGASGSGKTTLLRVLAGLETADSGRALIDGRPVTGVGRARAVAFGLEVRGEDPGRADERARHYIALVGLADFQDAYPKQLSGGMAQRVGLARALTVQPEILLLDEPLGALDAMTKLTMQQELERIWREENVTMVLVTHDLEEALYLADRVLILPKQKDASPRLIGIDLPRPRDRSEARFVRYRQELLREFGLH